MTTESPTSVSAQQSSVRAIDATTSAAVKIPTCSYGVHLEALSCHLGLPKPDVALAVASFLCNVAGPYAGLLDWTGRRTPTGLSMLHVGNMSSGTLALEGILLQPLQNAGRYIRDRARTIPRQLADRYVFGRSYSEATLDNELLKAFIQLRDQDSQTRAMQETLLSYRAVPHELVNERMLSDSLSYLGRDMPAHTSSPGSIHLPTFMVEGVDLNDVTGILEQTIHRDLFVIHPTKLFAQDVRSRPPKGSQSFDLGRLMRGIDLRFEPVHRSQGHGTLELARMHIWGATPLGLVGEVLASPASSWQSVLQNCLLWSGNQQPPPKQPPEAAGSATGLLSKKLVSVLNKRLFGQSSDQARVALSPDLVGDFQNLQAQYRYLMDKCHSADKDQVIQFHDLPERLFWAFSLLHDKREPYWCLQAAFHTAVYAINTKRHYLKQARSAHLEETVQKALRAVCAILRRRGPCTIREIQRSSNNLRADFLRPGIERLQQLGRLRQMADRRYELLATSEPITSKSNIDLLCGSANTRSS